MADLARPWQQAAPESQTDDDEYRTTAEDAALVLSLVIVCVLSGTLITFVLLEFFEILPTRVGTVFLATLLIFCVVVGRALLHRVLSIPPEYHSEAAVLRRLSRGRRSAVQV
jgi:putative copper export protein